MEFEIGERVLCSHMGSLYEAKILKHGEEGYQVHYQGWKTKYAITNKDGTNGLELIG